LNIYDFVYLGKITKATAERILTSTGSEYKYNPTLPAAKMQIAFQTLPAIQEKIAQDIPITKEEEILGVKVPETVKSQINQDLIDQSELTKSKIEYYSIPWYEVTPEEYVEAEIVYDEINKGNITVDRGEEIMEKAGAPLDYSKINVPYEEESEINQVLKQKEKEPVLAEEKTDLVPIALAGALLLLRSI